MGKFYAVYVEFICVYRQLPIPQSSLSSSLSTLLSSLIGALLGVSLLLCPPPSNHRIIIPSYHRRRRRRRSRRPVKLVFKAYLLQTSIAAFISFDDLGR